MKMIAFATAVILQSQASEIRVEQSYSSNRQSTAQNVTRSGYDYSCTFFQANGAEQRLSLRLRGGRGYQTGRSDFPVSRTPLTVKVLMNETSADLSMDPAVRLQDDTVIMTSHVDGEPAVHLTIQPDWSSPTYKIDGVSAADIYWGPILESGSGRWFANSLEGSCNVTEVVQSPLSESETSELLGQ